MFVFFVRMILSLLDALRGRTGQVGRTEGCTVMPEEDLEEWCDDDECTLNVNVMTTLSFFFCDDRRTAGFYCCCCCHLLTLSLSRCLSLLLPRTPPCLLFF